MHGMLLDFSEVKSVTVRFLAAVLGRAGFTRSACWHFRPDTGNSVLTT